MMTLGYRYIPRGLFVLLVSIYTLCEIVVFPQPESYIVLILKDLQWAHAASVPADRGWEA